MKILEGDRPCTRAVATACQSMNVFIRYTNLSYPASPPHESIYVIV